MEVHTEAYTKIRWNKILVHCILRVGHFATDIGDGKPHIEVHPFNLVQLIDSVKTEHAPAACPGRISGPLLTLLLIRIRIDVTKSNADSCLKASFSQRLAHSLSPLQTPWVGLYQEVSLIIGKLNFS